MNIAAPGPAADERDEHIEAAERLDDFVEELLCRNGIDCIDASQQDLVERRREG